MKLFKNRNKDKEIEAEASAKSAENVNVTEAADTVKTQTIQDEAPETIVCPKCGKTILKLSLIHI